MATTLPNDKHNLGLLLGVCILVGLGYQIIMLGDDTPIESILQASKQQDTSVVLISYSLHKTIEVVEKELRQIRENLPSTVYMMTGGPFSALKIIGVENFTSFDSFTVFAEKIYQE